MIDIKVGKYQAAQPAFDLYVILSVNAGAEVSGILVVNIFVDTFILLPLTELKGLAASWVCEVVRGRRISSLVLPSGQYTPILRTYQLLRHKLLFNAARTIFFYDPPTHYPAARSQSLAFSTICQFQPL